jgi:hypothetical protein
MRLHPGWANIEAECLARVSADCARRTESSAGNERSRCLAQLKVAQTRVGFDDLQCWRTGGACTKWLKVLVRMQLRELSRLL